MQVFERSPLHAKDETPSIESVQEFINHTNNIENIALIQVTSPFLNERYLNEAIKKMETKKCVFSVTPSFKLRWKEDNGTLKPLNFNLKKRPRRQDWPGEFVENGMFYISHVSLLKENAFQNEYCDYVVVDPIDSLEIDTPYHLKLAQIMIKVRYE